MAKGKKSKGTNYVSKGERPSVKRNIVNAVRRDVDPWTRAINALEAHEKGKRAYLTVPTSSKKEPMKRVLVKHVLPQKKDKVEAATTD